MTLIIIERKARLSGASHRRVQCRAARVTVTRVWQRLPVAAVDPTLSDSHHHLTPRSTYRTLTLCSLLLSHHNTAYGSRSTMPAKTIERPKTAPETPSLKSDQESRVARARLDFKGLLNRRRRGFLQTVITLPLDIVYEVSYTTT